MKSYKLQLIFVWPETVPASGQSFLAHTLFLQEGTTFVDLGRQDGSHTFSHDDKVSIEVESTDPAGTATPREVIFQFSPRGKSQQSSAPIGDGKSSKVVLSLERAKDGGGGIIAGVWEVKGDGKALLARAGDWNFTITVPVDGPGGPIDFIWDPEMIVGSGRSGGDPSTDP